MNLIFNKIELFTGGPYAQKLRGQETHSIILETTRQLAFEPTASQQSSAA